MIIAYGDGRNGKSTFWNVIYKVLGSYSGNISADALTVNCKRNVKPEMAELKLRDSEKDTLTETYELPDGFLETQPWVIAVTLIGDHRVEANSMNRTGSRKDTTDYDSADNGDKDGDAEEALADPYRRAFNWYDGRIYEAISSCVIPSLKYIIKASRCLSVMSTVCAIGIVNVGFGSAVDWTRE